MSEERPRLLLADDHGLVAAGVRGLLESRYEVVGVAPDGRRLLELAVAERPDLILTDISMPGLDGLEVARRLRRELPGIPIVFLTMHDDAGHARAAFEAGAAGYLVKSSAPLELFEALETVLAGRRYLTASIAGEVLGSLLSPPDARAEPTLTRREIEVASLGQGAEQGPAFPERLYGKRRADLRARSRPRSRQRSSRRAKERATAPC